MVRPKVWLEAAVGKRECGHLPKGLSGAPNPQEGLPGALWVHDASTAFYVLFGIIPPMLAGLLGRPLGRVLIDYSLSHPQHLTKEVFIMGKKVYVGNLAFSVTENSLNDLFSQHGAVDSCQLITDRETGRSKGFGFVEMSTDEEAEKAISALSGHEFEGRALTVNEARPQAPRSGGGGGGGFGGGGGGGGNRRGGRY